jgi:hypothetical protein
MRKLLFSVNLLGAITGDIIGGIGGECEAQSTSPVRAAEFLSRHSVMKQLQRTSLNQDTMPAQLIIIEEFEELLPTAKPLNLEQSCEKVGFPNRASGVDFFNN